MFSQYVLFKSYTTVGLYISRNFLNSQYSSFALAKAFCIYSRKRSFNFKLRILITGSKKLHTVPMENHNRLVCGKYFAKASRKQYEARNAVIDRLCATRFRRNKIDNTLQRTTKYSITTSLSLSLFLYDPARNRDHY